MSFRSLEEDTPFIAITVEPPVEDSEKLYYSQTQFISGEDQGASPLHTLGQLDDVLFGPLSSFPGSPFTFADDSTGSTPSIWMPRSPADPLSPCDFEKPLEDILNSPGTPHDLSPAGSPLSLNFDHVTLDDEHAANYLAHYGGSTFRNRPYNEPGTVAPRDILHDVDSFSMLHADGTNKVASHLMPPLFEGDAEDNQTHDLVAFGQPTTMGESLDIMTLTDSSALFSGNQDSLPTRHRDHIPIAPPSSQQPQSVYLNVHGHTTKHRHSLSDSNLIPRIGPIFGNTSPHIADFKSLSLQTQFNSTQTLAQQTISPQSAYLSPDAEPHWRKTRMRANSASNPSFVRHSPYSRTSPRRSSDQLPLTEETDLHRHASDPTGSSKYGANRMTRSSRRKTVQEPVAEEAVSPYASQSSLDARSFSSTPHSPASSSGSVGIDESNSNLTKPVVASEKCKVASEKRRIANKTLYACTVEGCGSTFTAKHNVANHLNSHFGRRPYQCKNCDGTFATSGTCNRHEKNCNGTKRV